MKIILDENETQTIQNLLEKEYIRIRDKVDFLESKKQQKNFNTKYKMDYLSAYSRKTYIENLMEKIENQRGIA